MDGNSLWKQRNVLDGLFPFISMRKCGFKIWETEQRSHLPNQASLLIYFLRAQNYLINKEKSKNICIFSWAQASIYFYFLSLPAPPPFLPLFACFLLLFCTFLSGCIYISNFFPTNINKLVFSWDSLSNRAICQSSVTWSFRQSIQGWLWMLFFSSWWSSSSWAARFCHFFQRGVGVGGGGG